MRDFYARLRPLLTAAGSLSANLLLTRSRRSATIWVIVIVNVALIALYIWSYGGASTTIRLEATDLSFRGFVDGRLVHEGVFRAESRGGIGLLLSRNYRLPALPDPNGVDWVRVTDAETGEVLFEDDFNGEPSSLWENERGLWRTEDGVFTTDGGTAITTGFQPWSDVILEAKFRNITEATVFVRVQNAQDAVVLGVGQFRSFGGATLARSEGGTAVERLDLVRLEVDRGQTFQSITAMLLRPYPLALLMIVGLTVLAFVVRVRRLESILQAVGRAVPEMATGIAIGLAAGTFVLLWYLLYIVGDAMPRVPDSVLYVFQGKIFASGHLTADAPPARESFSIFSPHMLQVIDGRWFTQYLFGHPMFLAAGHLVGAVWLVPPLLGALSVAMIYWVGKRMYGISVGLVAAVLLFSSPFFLMTGSNFMSHNTAAFTLIASLFLITLPTKRRLLAMFFAGVFLGLLFNNRALTAVAFMPVLAGFMAYELLSAGPLKVPPKPWLLAAAMGAFLVPAAAIAYVAVGGLPALLVLSPLVIPAAFLGYRLIRDRTKRGDLFREDLAFAVGALLLFGAYFLYNLATTGDLATNPYAAQGTFRSDAFGFGGNHSFTLGLQNEQELLSLMLLVANGWPLWIGLIVAALPFVLGTRNRWDYFLAASFLAIATAPIFYQSAAIMHGPRYWYESLPFLILLTARGAQYLATASSNAADWLTGRLRKSTSMTSSGITGLATYSIIAALVGLSLYSWMFGDRAVWGDEDIGVRTFTPASASVLEGFNFTDDRLLDEADRLGLDDALVFVETCPQWWCYGSVFWTNSPDLGGDIVWAEQQTTPDDLTLLDQFPGRTVYVANYARTTITKTARDLIVEQVEERLAEDPNIIPPSETTTPEERDAMRLDDFVVIAELLNRYAQENGLYPNTDNNIQSLCAYRTLDVGCDLESVGPIPIDPLRQPIQYGYWYLSDGESFTIIALDEAGSESPSPCPEGLFGEDDARLCFTGPTPVTE